MKTVCVIPARLASTRFPRKVLAPLKGKPLLQWVWEAAMRVSLFDTVVCAIDAEETKRIVEGFGGRALMTSPACGSGTERIVELVQKHQISADIIVNWQADEPFITDKMVHDLLQSVKDGKSDLWTLMKKMDPLEDPLLPHFVKVVVDSQNYALYFSRSAIPYFRDVKEQTQKIYFKHIGMYAYTRKALLAMSSMSSCGLEEAEKLEQLRFLYHGLKIQVHETQEESLGIDIPEHLREAEKRVHS